MGYRPIRTYYFISHLYYPVFKFHSGIGTVLLSPCIIVRPICLDFFCANSIQRPRNMPRLSPPSYGTACVMALYYVGHDSTNLLAITF